MIKASLTLVVLCLGWVSASPILESRQTSQKAAVAAFGQQLGNAVKNESAPPTSINGVVQLLANVGKSNDLGAAAVVLLENGIDPSRLPFPGYAPALNSFNNSNPVIAGLYNKPGDAPYDVSEKDLRSAMYFPSTFTNGTKPPVILVPGTGEAGGNTFYQNMYKLLKDKPYADPMWINIPGYQLNDAQENAEFVAYAIGYVYARTGCKNVSVISWSQGTLSTQWSLKYWPSTRNITSLTVGLSPDTYGTETANGYQVATLGAFGPPSLIQQKQGSNFLKALALYDGTSAYVPAIEIRSATDEIVQPQTGPAPSGVLMDNRHVGVQNVLVQQYCPATDADTPHEGTLYFQFPVSLTMETLRTGKPADPLAVSTTGGGCLTTVAAGLTLNDVLASEATIPYAGGRILQYEIQNVSPGTEPPLKPYATKQPSA